ncbi:hypothetical protein SKAU_G00264040 [Synaphobranchus kaupii]|uniref:Solute carrier family 35 member F2 n=1 Tax=Synaphobranchus kaupii TaxID=118154 RepID=A0A9Q1EYX7_SYNKA|nr:hypothetical protein SKAU_G00264040 [Synaphobranchus kaupii]
MEDPDVSPSEDDFFSYMKARQSQPGELGGYLACSSQASGVLLGDGLVLISAALYAVSNVCQEYTVKNLSRTEFLGMVGLFGTLISGIQLAVLEHKAVAVIKWDWTIVLLFTIYGLCMFALYSFMPMVMKMTSATAVNLSLLTADLFSLFCGLYIFRYTFSGLYIVSFLVITVGFVMFNAVPTLTPVPVADPSEGGSENPSDEEEAVKHEAILEVPSESDEQEGGAESECMEMQWSQRPSQQCTVLCQFRRLHTSRHVLRHVQKQRLVERWESPPSLNDMRALQDSVYYECLWNRSDVFGIPVSM